jgi:hypothetical protein
MAFSVTEDRLYLNIPWGEERWEQEAGLEWDDQRKLWWMPRGLDPLKHRDYWAFLDRTKTYDDRADLKKRGCRWKASLKTWYVPENLDFDDFVKWWPTDLQKFVLCERYAIHKDGEISGQANIFKAWDVVDDTGYFAAKVYKKSDEAAHATAQQINAANAEIGSLMKLGEHPNILALEAWEKLEETGRYCLITKWAVGGSCEKLIGKSHEDKLRSLYSTLRDSGYDLEESEDEFVQSILDESKDEQKDDWLDEADFLIGILEGLQYAHDQGIYHRDLKPANVLIQLELDEDTGNYSVKPLICDFGASKIRSTLADVTNWDKTLVSVRTPAYRWEPDNSKEYQKEMKSQNTWDLVAWGIIAIEFLANEKVDAPEAAVELLNGKLAKELDEELIGLLSRAIAKDPDERPSDIPKFKDQIVDFTERRKQKLNWVEC